MSVDPFPITIVDVATIRIAIVGRLVQENRQDFKREVLDQLARGKRHIILNCLECEYIDSTGLGVLVTLRKKIGDAGGTLVIENLNDDLRTLFGLTKLDVLFGVN
jgi:anti-sigma B factor antagonist